MPATDTSDFQTLDSFPLKWRWTDQRWNKIPVAMLAQIQPYSEAKARELCQYSLRFSDQSGLIEHLFEDISSIDTSGKASEIQRWLLNCYPEVGQQVIVSWSDDLAALISWEVFCKYWDDFCYPASDDVAIWPPTKEWMLVYEHHEAFIFGRRRAVDGSAT